MRSSLGADDMTDPHGFFDAFAARPRPSLGRILRPAVGQDGARLRDTLAGATPRELPAETIRTEVEGNLSMLSPEAFRYFLPAFLHAALDAYDTLSIFASELIGALTEPSREDVVESRDRLAQIPRAATFPQATMDLLRQQQLAWYDEGIPQALFRDRVEPLTDAEGAAILAFFIAMRDAHDDDFPFDELAAAIDRRWGRYATP
jgi:hypothetical protein